MKTMVQIMIVLLIAGTCGAELDGLKAKYEQAQSVIDADFSKEQAEALASYGKALDTFLTHLKECGQLDAYLALEKEKARFEAEKSVPPSDARTNSSAARVVAARYDQFVDKALIDKCKRTKFLIGQYVRRLDALIRYLMLADRMEEAQLAKAEKDRVNFVLTVVEREAPQTQAPEKTPDGEVSPRPPVLLGSTRRKVTMPGEVSRFGEHYYHLSETFLNWKKAKNACESVGGHLATITSADEYEFVQQLAGNDYVYVGHSDSRKEGKWVMVNHEKSDFVRWRTGEPNGGRGENVGSMNREGLHDTNDSDTRRYICEWDSRE